MSARPALPQIEIEMIDLSRHKLRGTRRGAGGSMDLKRVKKEAAELEKDADSAGVTAKVRLRT